MTSELGIKRSERTIKGTKHRGAPAGLCFNPFTAAVHVSTGLSFTLLKKSVGCTGSICRLWEGRFHRWHAVVFSAKSNIYLYV